MFDDIKGMYMRYNNWVQDFQGESNISQKLMRLFSHNREFNARPEHRGFYFEVEERAKEIYEWAKQENEDVYELIHYVYIDCYGVAVKSTAFMYLAAEQIFVPFLELLTKEEVIRLEAEYRQRRRKDPGLPIQTKIKKYLKQLASS